MNLELKWDDKISSKVIRHDIRLVSSHGCKKRIQIQIKMCTCSWYKRQGFCRAGCSNKEKIICMLLNGRAQTLLGSLGTPQESARSWGESECYCMGGSESTSVSKVRCMKSTIHFYIKSCFEEVARSINKLVFVFELNLQFTTQESFWRT